MTIIWPGTPGEAYENSGETIVYQLVCSLVNTCGVCYQYNLAIAKWWSKFHHGCNCESRPIYPGKKSAPYEDWREIIAGLPEDQQIKVVGKANKQLIDGGVVEWGDVVTSTRVRLLREVVSREGLTVRDMTRVGVKLSTAEQAYQTVNTPDHQLANQQRTELIKQITDLGIKPETLREMFGDKMARRIGLSGPSGPETIPPGMTDAQWIEILLRPFKPPKPKSTPKPKPKPKPAPTPAPAPAPAPGLEARILEEAPKLTIAGGRGYLDALHAKVGGSTEEFKKALYDLAIKGDIVLYQLDHPKEAAAHTNYPTPSGSERHIFYMPKGSVTGPTARPPVTHPVTVEEFAQRAMDAASAVPPDLRYGEDKVWITDAYSEYLTKYPGATLDEFKASLVEANMARLLTFAVMDLPHRLSKADRQKSEDSATIQGRLQYHFLRLMQKQR